MGIKSERCLSMLIISMLAVAASCGASTPTDLETGPTGLTCEETQDTAELMMAGWSAAHMSMLQSAADKSVLVVRYDGCELELLPDCHLEGAYQDRETARSNQKIIIRNVEELHEELPLNASSLEDEVVDDASLVLSFVTVGTRSARISPSSKGMIVGNCERATHFVRSIVVGAYELGSISSGGDLEKCRDGEADMDEMDCQGVVQVLLTPLSEMSSERDDLYGNVSDTMKMEAAVNAFQSMMKLNLDSDKDRGSAQTDLGAKLLRLPDGGSDGWDGLVKRILVEEFDKDKSGLIDTTKEVSSIPCDVFISLDRSIRAGRGESASLRTTYGFPQRFRWVGGVLGFDEKVRVDADARLENCGL